MFEKHHSINRRSSISSSISVRSFSRPLSMIFTDIGDKATKTLRRKSAYIALVDAPAKVEPRPQLDDTFDPKALLTFDFEENDKSFASECFGESSAASDDSFDFDAVSPITSSRVSTTSSHSYRVKRDHGVYIFHDESALTVQEAYNPFEHH